MGANLQWVLAAETTVRFKKLEYEDAYSFRSSTDNKEINVSAKYKVIFDALDKDGDGREAEIKVDADNKELIEKLKDIGRYEPVVFKIEIHKTTFSKQEKYKIEIIDVMKGKETLTVVS